VQCLRHLREADAADLGERVEELPQRSPRNIASRQGGIEGDRPQGSLDRPAALEDRPDLGRRDPGAVAVCPPQVGLVERRRVRRARQVEAPLLEEAEDDAERILDPDAVAKDDRARRAAQVDAAAQSSQAPRRTTSWPATE
jgi:hypothetical protein